MGFSDTDGERSAGAHARAREGVEHLQAAARELIEAARAALDVAEEVVNDPESVAALAGSMATMGDIARRFGVAGGGVGRPVPGADRRPTDPGAGDMGADDDRAGDGRVQRIRVT